MKYLIILLISLSFISYSEESVNDVKIVQSIIQGIYPNSSGISPDMSDLATYQSDIQVYFQQRKLLSGLNDAHIQLIPSEHLQKILEKTPVFPGYVSIYSGKIFSNDPESIIPLGSEITSINQKTSDSIIRELLLYSFLDGKKESSRAGILEQEFSLLLLNYLGENKKFSVTYIQKEKSHNISLTAIPLKQLYQRSTPPESYQIENSICQGNICNATLGLPTGPVLYSRIPDFAESFDFNLDNSKGFIEDIITSSKRDKVQDIIFDIRNNPGGLREITMALSAPLVDNKFQQRNLSVARPSENYFPDYMVNPTQGKEIRHLLSNFKPCKQGLCMPGDHLSYLSIDDIFLNKNIWILVNNRTSSAAVEFAGVLKKFHKNTNIIGQETAGSYQFHSGDYAIQYRLPESGNIMELSLIGIYQEKSAILSQDIRGIIPDISCPVNGTHLANQQDAYLDCAISAIQGQYR